MSNRQLNYLTEVTRPSQELFKNNYDISEKQLSSESVDAIDLSQQQDIYYQFEKTDATLFHKKVKLFSKRY